MTTASREQGIDELRAAIGKHREWMTRTGELRRRRINRARIEIEALASAALQSRFAEVHSTDDLAAQVVDGKLAPYTAADRVLASAG